MTIESAKRVLFDALAFGEDRVQALARRVLEELETPEERSRRLARERQQRSRDKRDASVTGSPTEPPSGHADVTLDGDAGHASVTRLRPPEGQETARFSRPGHAQVTHGGVGGGLSVVSEISQITERDRARERDASVTPGRGVTLVIPGARYPLAPDFMLTDERRAFAEMVGATDVPDLFETFRPLSVEKQWVFDAPGWEERWKRFARDSRKFQRMDRERARAFPAAPTSSSSADLNPNPVTRKGPSKAERDAHRQIVEARLREEQEAKGAKR